MLCFLAEQVFAIERIAPLAKAARARLDQLELENAVIKHGDGLLGWPEFAPFDAIIMAACPEQVPDVVLAQLAIGGRLIAPVGQGAVQSLTLFQKTEDGLTSLVVDEAFFVPALGGVA